MFIALESLFNGGIDELPLQYEYDFSAENVNGVFPFTTPVKLSGKIVRNAEIVSVDAVVSFSLDVVCDRCAESTRLDFNVPMNHILVSEVNDEDNDDYIIIEDMKLDIEQLTLEDIYLALPSKFLCADDCKGVCPSCGVNLNTSSCGCKKEVDPRLEALLELLND